MRVPAIISISLGVLTLLAIALLQGPAREPASADWVTWTAPLEVAQGDARRGPWQMNDSEFHYVDDPTVAINDQGIIGVAWADQTQQDIFFQRFGADGQPQLEQPVNVSRSPEVFSWLPRLVIATDDAQNIYILWQDIVFSGGSHGGEIFFSRSTDGGRSFSPPMNLSNTVAGAGKGRLSANRWDNGSLDLIKASGNIYAAWSEYEGRLQFSRSMDNGQHFSAPITLAGPNPPARGPALAADAAGALYLAWTVGEDDAADIHITQSQDQGQSFQPSQVVHRSEGHSEAPKIAVDRQGTLHLVYGESPAGRRQRYHIRYTQRAPEAAEFSPPKAIAADHSDTYQSVNFPALGLDADDTLYVLWDLFPRWRDRPRGLGLTRSQDGGQSFADPIAIPATLNPELGAMGSQQGLLMRKLAVNEDGAIAIAYSTFRPQTASHIWLIRGQH
ncbi:sialidase family protein [Nodosilinea sp. P-1105]|uniref:sialidase family protein n=1 Tax=Nodosilinea sp. P-1105 TaxID=2546229 RepID=UPI00146B81C4|nr:sialidase family protein [Nodosilinea sp. P-1105]